MIQLIDPALEAYAAKCSTEPSSILQELEAYTYEHCKVPQMVSGSHVSALLRMLVQLTHSSRILEVGLFTGYSALSMAEALPEGGAVVSCEINPEHAEIAQSFFDRSPHGKKIDIVLGPALASLDHLKGPFDMAFLDADKENYSAYYRRILSLLKPGGLLVADNVLWSGKVLEPQDTDDHALAEFNHMVSTDPQVEVTLLTIRDGVSLIRKR